jgi:hypothetical protein
MPDNKPCPRCKGSLYRVAAQHHHAGADVGYVCACGYHEIEFHRKGLQTETVGHPALTLDSGLFVHRQIFKRLQNRGRQGHA